MPDAKTLVRLGQLLDGPALQAVLARVVTVARERQVTRGRRLRIDTTVVEAAIRHPTDSGRCADAIRVVSRALRGPCPGCRPTGPPRIVCNAMTLGFALRALLSLGLALCLAALLAMMLYFGWDDYRLGDHDYQHDLQEQRLLAFHTRLARIMLASLFMFAGAALVLWPLSR